MEIKKLIEKLTEESRLADAQMHSELSNLLMKAAETIKLL